MGGEGGGGGREGWGKGGANCKAKLTKLAANSTHCVGTHVCMCVCVYSLEFIITLTSSSWH